MDRIEILKSQYLVWRRDPVTKALVQDLLHEREMLKESWAQGHLVGDEQIAALGRCKGFQSAIDTVLDLEVVDDTKEESEKDV